MVLARVRQVIAFLLVAVAAGHFFIYYFSTAVAGDHRQWLNPAVIFYPLALLGLGLRLFWGRYLAICFAASMFAIHLLLGRIGWPAVAGGAFFILLLSGRSMRQFFDERPGRFNRWAGVEERVYRLRWLILAQSVALGLFWALHFELGLPAVAVVAVASAGLLGMVLQKVWGMVLLGLATLGEAGLTAALGFELARMPADYLTHRALPILAALVLLVATSLVLMAPFWLRFFRQLRQGPPSGATTSG
jgi:hypothetical protein